MKQTRYRLIFTALAAVALLASGCSKEPQGTDGNTATGKMVSVALPLDFAGTETTAQRAAAAPATKATSNTIDGFTVSLGDGSGNTKTNAPTTRTIAQELTDVWVLQFNSSGENVSTNNTGALAADTHLTTPELEVGTGYTIYVVANGVASGLSITNPATLADFESKMLHTAAVTDATKLPMSGKLTGVSVVDLGDGKGKLKLLDGSSAVTLTRIHAEITLTVDFDVTGYKLTNAQLYNVPVGVTYGWNRSTTTFPDGTVVANFGFTDASVAGMEPLTPTTSGTKTTYKWFTGDNRRGEIAGLTTQSDRNTAKAPAYATFARVTLTNSTTDITKIYYDIYLGSGSVTNFDLARNHTYTATAAIKGTANFQGSLVDEDDRVSGTNVPNLQIYLTDDKADSPIIISPKSAELAPVIWGPSAVISGVGDIFNGKANTDALMKLSNASEYLAAKHCRDTGAKWYLPAQAELMLIDIYRSAIPDEEQMREIIFWSSTASSISTILRAQFPIGFVASSSIEPSRALGVRCVREGKATTWSYPKVVNGNTIVSRDGATGIKQAALLTDDQKNFLMNQTADGHQYDHTGEYNKVSAKFEVGVSTGTTKLNTWKDANDYCKTHTTQVGVDQAWRLPTLRELMLIWTFKSKLTGANTLEIGAFWSSTDYPGLKSTWVLDFSNGNVGNSTGDSYYVRCVRDLGLMDKK